MPNGVVLFFLFSVSSNCGTNAYSAVLRQTSGSSVCDGLPWDATTKACTAKWTKLLIACVRCLAMFAEGSYVYCPKLKQE